MKTRLFAFALLCAVLAAPACAWEPTGHTLITEHALALVPKEMKPFYDANSRYIVAFCTLPDDWRETYRDEIGPNHFIDLDLLSKPPFADLIVDRATAEKRFGKDKLLKAGVLPWAIEDCYNKLVKAMKSGDSVQIALQSALLAHYIGDAHVPLHELQGLRRQDSRAEGHPLPLGADAAADRAQAGDGQRDRAGEVRPDTEVGVRVVHRVVRQMRRDLRCR